jgi:hypothetical protein
MEGETLAMLVKALSTRILAGLQLADTACLEVQN